MALKEVNLNQIVDGVMHADTKQVVLGFTPQDLEDYQKSLVNEEDTTLFIKGGKATVFRTEEIMFPVLSHA